MVDSRDNLFAGQGLDALAMAAEGAKLDRISASMEVSTCVPEGEELFSGDINALDPAALAAQAAEMEKLVAGMEEALEHNEQDIHGADEQWSVAAKISDIDDERPGNNSSSKLEEITHKINRIAVKTLAEEEEEEERKKAEEEKKKQLEEQAALQAKQQAERAALEAQQKEEEEEEEEEEDESEESEPGETEEEDVNDNMSIDDSASDSVESDASSLTTLKSDEEREEGGSDESDNNTEALHLSSKSLSLTEIQMDHDDSSSYDVGGDLETLVQNGILRRDSASEAYVCDWNQWRQWKKTTRQQSQNNRSSQRWDSSFQDSSLKMPKRRTSDDDMSGTTNFSDSGEVSFFDWKAWRQRKGSSTSHTSFSMSDDQDGFDADSVLKKLDEWEDMEEDDQQDDNNSSSSSNEEDPSQPQTSQQLNRASSEVFKPRRATVPMRAHSDHSLGGGDEDDGGDQWKDWQREKRKRKMQASFTNISGHLSQSSGDDSFGNSSDGSWGDSSFATDSWADGSFTNDNNNDTTAPLRTQSERMAPKGGPPRRQLRSQSLQIKPPSRRSLHMSPMRSPMQKAGDSMDQWKSWHKEKRRTGMLKKQLSSNGGWGLPFNDDSGDNNNRNKHLKKSQSEKWNSSSKQTKSTNTKGDRRQHFQRAQSESLHIPNSDDDSVAFDWNAYRKDQRRSDFQRSKSDRWASGASTAATRDQDKPPAINGLRRAQSESDMKQAATDSNLPTPKANDTAFDWKAFRKDRRRTLKKSNSENITIEVSS